MESLGRHEDYGQEALNETHLVADPIEQFKLWLKEAEAAGIYEPNAFVLSTVTAEHQPRARTVLLKGVDEHGFFFATNYLSKKGQAIKANPKVSAVFGWYSIYHQVIIEGIAKVVPDSESDEYHNSRPHDSQVAAWSSHQSAFIENRETLDKQFEDALEKFKDSEVPRPDYWGGYRIVPTRIEFWKGRSNRMHDRIEYLRTLKNDGTFTSWEIQRLQP
jgi:pyridoxamine 5'-phosphate oxidase